MGHVSVTDIAQWILTNRKRRCWSQEHLARRVGVDKQTVETWETGKSIPRQHNQLKLRDAFGQEVRG